MKFRYLLTWFLTVPNFVSGFQIQHHKEYRKIRLLNAITLKRNAETFSKTKDSVSSNMCAIVKDDLANDLLYYMRFYHLTSDEQVSYFYIVFYELLSFMMRNEEHTIKQLHISMLNVMVYILIKNILINQFIHHSH